MTAPLPDELPPQFEFGGYIIHECIGRGGMARVYRSEHTALRKAVALKVLDRWVVEKPGGAERFLREARTAAAIKHPNVVDIVDVGVWEHRPFIVMELLHGCDLDSELERRGGLPDNEVAAIALPIIAGMIAVHDAGVVHRDIKPSNIFLATRSDGEVVPKVLDFGISKFSDHLIEPLQGLTGTREIVGTPTYMAPEALNGARELGPRADQYAIGAVLYDCAVGRPPFEGETLLELLKKIAIGEIAPPRSLRPEISPELERAIERAMSGDPGQRFDTLRDLGRAIWPLADERTRTIWSRNFGSTGLASPREQTTQTLVGNPRPRPALRRRRRWWLPVSLAALALLSASGLFLWSRQSANSPGPASGEHVASLAPGEPSAKTTAQPAPARIPDPTRVDSENSHPAPVNLDTIVLESERAGSANNAGVVASADKRAKPSAKVVAPRKRIRSTDPGRPSAPVERDALAGLDPDLDQLFTSPDAPEGEPRQAAGKDSELDGIFRNGPGEPNGPNGSPLLD